MGLAREVGGRMGRLCVAEGLGRIGVVPCGRVGGGGGARGRPGEGTFLGGLWLVINGSWMGSVRCCDVGEVMKMQKSLCHDMLTSDIMMMSYTWRVDQQ